MNRYQIMLYGINRNYNLNKIIALRINLYAIKIEKKAIYIIISKEDYPKLKNIKHKIVNYYGPLKIKRMIQNNYILVIGIIIAVLIPLLLSKLIFKIDINHPNQNLRKIIRNDLKENGISKYQFQVSFKKKEKIKEKILAKERKRIDYLEIKRKGTKYIVELEERKEQNKKKDDRPRHIIATDDALITSIDAKEGEIIKKKYDYVKKGDILISGIIHNKEKEVAKVKSNGKVKGEVWYQVQVILPKYYLKQKKLNKIHHILSFNFFNKYLNLKKYKTAFIIKKRTIWQDSLLPITLEYITEDKTKIIKRAYNKNRAINYAIDIATKKLLDKLNKEDKILTKQALKINEKDSKIEVDIFFKVEKDITGYLSIENVQLKEGEEDAKPNS
ncbi:MAG: sporulation protein YqfD [Bacilli bacterium]|nr:sporulation protein YqfD [Bacilli bacterium]